MSLVKLVSLGTVNALVGASSFKCVSKTLEPGHTDHIVKITSGCMWRWLEACPNTILFLRNLFGDLGLVSRSHPDVNKITSGRILQSLTACANGILSLRNFFGQLGLVSQSHLDVKKLRRGGFGDRSSLARPLSWVSKTFWGGLVWWSRAQYVCKSVWSYEQFAYKTTWSYVQIAYKTTCGLITQISYETIRSYKGICL